jgi:hypothetical protein
LLIVLTNIDYNIGEHIKINAKSCKLIHKPKIKKMYKQNAFYIENNISTLSPIKYMIVHLKYLNNYYHSKNNIFKPQDIFKINLNMESVFV